MACFQYLSREGLVSGELVTVVADSDDCPSKEGAMDVFVTEEAFRAWECSMLPSLDVSCVLTPGGWILKDSKNHEVVAEGYTLEQAVRRLPLKYSPGWQEWDRTEIETRAALWSLARAHYHAWALDYPIGKSGREWAHKIQGSSSKEGIPGITSPRFQHYTNTGRLRWYTRPVEYGTGQALPQTGTDIVLEVHRPGEVVVLEAIVHYGGGLSVSVKEGGVFYGRHVDALMDALYSIARNKKHPLTMKEVRYALKYLREEQNNSQY